MRSSVVLGDDMLYSLSISKDKRITGNDDMSSELSGLKKVIGGIAVSSDKDISAADEAAEIARLELAQISQVLNGDQEAFRPLFEKYYPRILAAATRILGNSAEASDLTQEAFLKAFKSLESFKGSSSFYTWVHRILVNACIDFKRKSSTKNEIPTGEDYILAGDGNDPMMAPFHGTQWAADDLLYAKELKSIIGSALNELSDSHKNIIIQREVEGLSYEEISKVSNCSLGTVMSRLFHARKKLVSILEAKMQAKEETTKDDFKRVSVG